MIKSTAEHILALIQLKQDLSEAMTPILKAFAAKTDNVLPDIKIGHLYEHAMTSDQPAEYFQTEVTLLHKI